MTEPRPSSPPLARIALVAFLAAILVSLSSLSNGFTFDDISLAEKNPLTRSLANLPRLFVTPYWGDDNENGLYRPLVIASYALNHAAHGSSPFGYHAVNVALAGLAAALAAALAARLFGRADAGLLAGLLFATHPIHTEAIAGVVGRAELLAAAAVLGALVLETAPREARRRAVPLAVFVFFLGLLSKENAVALLPALFLLEWRGGVRLVPAAVAAARRALPYVPAIAAYAALRFAALHGQHHDVDPLDNPIVAAAFPATTLTALKAFALSAWLSIVPVRLSPDYSFDAIPVARSLLHPGPWAGAAALAGLLAAGVRLRPRAPAAAFGCLFFVAAILPVSNLLFPIGTIFGERLLYLPSFGAVLALAALLVRAPRPLAAAVIVLFGAHTATRNPEWRSNLVLFERAVAARPASAKNQAQLGFALQAKLDDAGAEEAFGRALAIAPDFPDVWSNLGAIRYRRGDAAGARAAWEKAIAGDPKNGPALANLATLEHAEGRLGEALRLYRAAAAARPRSEIHRLQLGSLLLEIGRPAEAAAEYRAAAEIAPADADAWHGLGNSLLQDGRAREALPAFERAAELEPHEARFVGSAGLALFECGNEARAEAELRRAIALDPALEVARFHLARVLGTAKDPAVRKPAEAIAIARRLAEAHPGDPAHAALLEAVTAPR